MDGRNGGALLFLRSEAKGARMERNGMRGDARRGGFTQSTTNSNLHMQVYHPQKLIPPERYEA